jgi:putative endonuclease
MFYVYIMTNKRNGTLYIGHTDDLIRRVWQHKSGEVPGFTSKYACYRLVWFAEFGERADAKDCEARMKAWRRAWKIECIEKDNPGWRDLWEDFFPLGARHARMGYQRPPAVADALAELRPSPAPSPQRKLGSMAAG